MTVMITVITGYFAYYIISVVQRPLLACRESPWREFLQKNLTILQESYWPTPWCLDGRLQSVMPAILRYRLPDVQFNRETLDLKDGGIISLDWVSKPEKRDQPIVILLPGLVGSSQSAYIKGFLMALQPLDVCCVVFNHRGMGNTELKTSKTYCGANSDDIEEAIEHIHSLYPHSPLVASGVSLGGVLVANYLATRGEKAAKYLVAGLVFSISWNFFGSMESLETPGWNLLINYSLTRSVCSIFEGFGNRLKGSHHPWNSDHVMGSKSIREFDDRFTAPNNGFRDGNDYYRSACLDDKLDKIKVPFLCLTAADDLFQPIKGLPLAKVENSSHVAIVVTSRGGHAGFMEGFFPVRTYYSDRLLTQFIKGIFSNLENLRNVKKEGDEYAQNSTHVNEHYSAT